MRLLCTGCPRSGTQWIARAITAAGVECGHEQAFTPYSQDLHSWAAESSWLAAPFAPLLLDDVHVVHLVRHPLAQIASQLARPENRRRAPWHRYAELYLPHLRGMAPLDWAAHMWVGWNRLAAADRRIRLEDVTAADVTRWARIVDPDAPGITELPPPSHRSKRPPPTVTWEQVEHVPRLVEVAAEYGYPRDRGPDRTPATSAR